MTLFLRDDENNSYIDIELWENDDHIELKPVVIILNYSQLSIKTAPEKQAQLIRQFVILSELRSWL